MRRFAAAFRSSCRLLPLHPGGNRAPLPPALHRELATADSSARRLPQMTTEIRERRETVVHAGSYGLMPAGGQAQPAGPAGSRRPGVAWPVLSGPVPPLAEGFAARPDTVPGLEAVLVRGAAVALVPGQEAAGHRGDWPGSCGKTQLASSAAGSLWRSRTVELLAWVTATSRASVLSGYVQAAMELGLDDRGDAESVAARFAAWLGGTGRPWLVVLDDLRDAADLDGLWPAGPAGRLLITAADPAAACGGRRVLAMPVPAFSTREAVSCLLGRLTTDPDQRSRAIDLAADLGGEPAAVAQAGAVITSSGLPSREYRHLFARRRAQLAAGGTGPLCAAAVTWTLSADHAEQLAPGAGSWLLLVLCAVLDGDGIPGTVLITPSVCRYLGEGAARPPDPKDAWTAVRALERAGLVAIGPAGTPPAVWVSPALQAAVRAIIPAEVLGRAVRAAADALLEAWPADQPRSWLSARLRSCAAGLGRVAGDGLWAGGSCHRVLLMAGQSLNSARLTGPAVTWWRELAAGCDRLLGPGHPDTLVAPASWPARCWRPGRRQRLSAGVSGCWPAAPACSGQIIPAPSRPRSISAARWWPPARPAPPPPS